MIINIDEFRVHKPLILDKYRESGLQYVSLYAAVAMVPVVALYCYLREEHPEDERLTKHIESLREFYGYKEIRGEVQSG